MKAEDLTCSYLGFSVPNNFVPVIYCSDQPYIATNYGNHRLTSTVFDDAEKYNVTYYGTTNPAFSQYHIYLTGDLWTNKVKSAPEGWPDPATTPHPTSVTISTEQQLAWLISYVNGLNDASAAWNASLNPYINVTLTADLDMGDYGWEHPLILE